MEEEDDGTLHKEIKDLAQVYQRTPPILTLHTITTYMSAQYMQTMSPPTHIQKKKTNIPVPSHAQHHEYH